MERWCRLSGMDDPRAVVTEQMPTVKTEALLALVAERDRVVAFLEMEIVGLRAELARMRTESTALTERIQELERRLGLNSRNSAKPPSTDGPGVTRRARGKGNRARGGRDGHEGKGRALLSAEDVSAFIDHVPERCRRCGDALVGTDAAPERIQTIELPPVRPTVEEHRIHSLTCARCGAVTKAGVPETLRGTPFGPRLHGVVALLSGLLRLSKREIHTALEVLFGVRVGLGSIPKMERRMRAALDRPYETVLTAIRGSPHAHQDTTGWREAKRRCHLWVTATDTLAHFQVTPQANRPTAKGILGEAFQGPVITDRAACQTWDRQQWCWSHLQRDFEALIELEGGVWYGDRLRACARRVHARYAEHRAGTITHAQMVELLEPTRRQVTRLLENAADHAPPLRVRRVCTAIRKGQGKLWTFLDHPGVPPTNNHAERCLRKAVLWRKSSFGTDSSAGSRFAERILTVVTSLRLQRRHRHILDWLVAARQAHAADSDCPSLLPAPVAP